MENRSRGENEDLILDVADGIKTARGDPTHPKYRILLTAPHGANAVNPSMIRARHPRIVGGRRPQSWASLAPVTSPRVEGLGDQNRLHGASRCTTLQRMVHHAWQGSGGIGSHDGGGKCLRDTIHVDVHYTVTDGDLPRGWGRRTSSACAKTRPKMATACKRSWTVCWAASFLPPGHRARGASRRQSPGLQCYDRDLQTPGGDVRAHRVSHPNDHEYETLCSEDLLAGRSGTRYGTVPIENFRNFFPRHIFHTGTTMDHELACAMKKFDSISRRITVLFYLVGLTEIVACTTAILLHSLEDTSPSSSTLPRP